MFFAKICFRCFNRKLSDFLIRVLMLNFEFLRGFSYIKFLTKFSTHCFTSKFNFSVNAIIKIQTCFIHPLQCLFMVTNIVSFGEGKDLGNNFSLTSKIILRKIENFCLLWSQMCFSPLSTITIKSTP